MEQNKTKTLLTWVGILIVVGVLVALVWSVWRVKDLVPTDVFEPTVQTDDWTAPVQPPCPSGECKG